MNIKLCDYGCGQEAKFFFKNARKWCCKNHWTKCSNKKGNFSKIRKNIPLTDDHKKNIGNSNKGKKRSKEFCERMRKSHLGHIHSEETRRKIGEHTASRNPEVRKKKSIATKKLFLNEDFLKKYRKSRSVKPNKKEKILIELLRKLIPESYKYVGGYDIWIGGKNPDFINEREKKIIEHYGTYYHKKEEEKERIEHFKNCGYSTLVIWENELENLDFLSLKILKFHEL
jgi:very-short-patch-repair endonuclease